MAYDGLLLKPEQILPLWDRSCKQFFPRHCTTWAISGGGSGCRSDQELVTDEFAASADEDRRLVKPARSYWLLLAEGHLNGKLFGDMLGRIWALPVPDG